MENERKKRKKRLGWIWVLVLVPLVYLAVQVYSTTNKPYRVQTALPVTVTDSVTATGVVVRDETVIAQETAGVIGHIAQNVQRVSSGTEVARVFSSAVEAQNFALAARLDEQASMLRQAQTDGTNAGTDVQLILRQVNTDLYGLISVLNSGYYGGVTQVQETLNYALNKLDIAIGKEAGYEDTIASLEQERDTLLAQGQAIASVYAPKTGFFFYDVDGYEGLTPEAASALDADALDALQQTYTPDTAAAAGKMVGSYRWYFYCTVDAAAAASFTTGAAVTLQFVDAGVSGVSATVQEVGQPTESGRLRVVLNCQQMEEDYADLRFETAEIEFSTYTGIRLNKDVIHFNEAGEQGVYIKFGTLVRFRRVNKIYETDTYILVPTTPHYSQGEGDTVPVNELELYDEILVEGSDLFDGKLL